jgi:hypothetical protein
MLSTTKFSDHQRLILPRKALRSRKLSASHKLFLGLVYALSTEKGYCFASNEYFAEEFDCDSTTPSKWVKKLKDLNFLFVAYKQKINKVERRLYVDESLYLQALKQPGIYADHGQKNGKSKSSNEQQLSLLASCPKEQDPSCPKEQDPSCPKEQDPSCPKEQQYKESNYKENIYILYEQLFEIFEETKSYKVDQAWMKLTDDEQKEILEFAPKYIKWQSPQYRMLLKNFVDPFKKGWRDALTSYNRTHEKRKNSNTRRNAPRVSSNQPYFGDKSAEKFGEGTTGQEFLSEKDLQL